MFQLSCFFSFLRDVLYVSPCTVGTSLWVRCTAVFFGAVAFEVLGVPLIYLIMSVSCALFAALCLETYGLRVKEVNALLYQEKMNARGR